MEHQEIVQNISSDESAVLGEQSRSFVSAEMQIRSDQRCHQRAAPPPARLWDVRPRTSVSSWRGLFPGALFLRGLEVWHAGADPGVPRLSLNLHVSCQLPCCCCDPAVPTLTPNTTLPLSESSDLKGKKVWKGFFFLISFRLFCKTFKASKPCVQMWRFLNSGLGPQK